MNAASENAVVEPATAVCGRSALEPVFLEVERRTAETGDVVSLDIALPARLRARAVFEPGQFNMLYAFGVGEVPISISGDVAISDRITHTIRAVGPVSRALCRLQAGQQVGMRGPYGNAWPLASAEGGDLLVIAGGIGLMPLRPVLHEVLRHRDRYRRVALLYGARQRSDLLFAQELAQWRNTAGLQFKVALNEGDRQWRGDVGIVTQLLPRIEFDPDSTVALLCGPEVMIRGTGMTLTDLGVDPARIFGSMERNMKCAVGTCGHCQFGPDFLCKDGPIFSYRHVRKRMLIREI